MNTTTYTSDPSSPTQPKHTSPPMPPISTSQDHSNVMVPTVDTGAIPKRVKKSRVLDTNTKIDVDVSQTQSPSSATSLGKWVIINHSLININTVRNK